MIPFIDLRSQYEGLRDELDRAVARVLRSGRYVLGPEVESFEHEFADFCEARYAVGVNSGTSALYLSLQAAGIGPGDEVVTVPFTFEATVAAIRWTGAAVRFVDVEARSLTMDPASLEASLNERTKAIVPVHLYGQPADMDPIRDVARRHGLLVVEDACQAHGATYKGRPVGSLGDLACFSFYPSKNLGTCGEGGIVLTGDRDLADALRRLRSWGGAQAAGNYRLSAIEAAVLRVKLPHLGDWTMRRQAIAARYSEALAHVPVAVPAVMPYAGHAFHVYALRVDNRQRLAATLRAKGIEVGIHYPLPVHLQPGHADLGYGRGAFPVAELAAREELSLPIYPELSADTVRHVAGAIRESYAATGPVGS